MFMSASELIYGSQTYGEGDDGNNTHKSFFTPSIITGLLVKAGFESVTVVPYNDRQTDMLVRCKKLADGLRLEKVIDPVRVGNMIYPNEETARVRATDAELAEEARKWDSGELKPTDPGWKDVKSEKCGSVGPGGAVCEALKGHDGKHHAGRKIEL